MNDDDADAALAHQQELECRQIEEDESMKIGDMMPSKYLGSADVKDKPLLLTISRFEEVNLAREGERPKMKWAMFFKEEDKPLIMNPTNLQLAAQALGTEETDNWVGRRIVAYFDPAVQYQGQLKGGVRLRAARVKQPEPVAPPQTEEDFDDSIPF